MGHMPYTHRCTHAQCKRSEHACVADDEAEEHEAGSEAGSEDVEEGDGAGESDTGDQSESDLGSPDSEDRWD